MGRKYDAKRVGKWAVAQTKTGETLLRFSWTDEPDQVFVLQGPEAEKIARTILDQRLKMRAATSLKH